MGKLVYRMCLVVVLVIVTVCGMYYYKTFYMEENHTKEATFVDQAADTGKQVKVAQANSGSSAGKTD